MHIFFNFVFLLQSINVQKRFSSAMISKSSQNNDGHHHVELSSLRNVYISATFCVFMVTT